MGKAPWIWERRKPRDGEVLVFGPFVGRHEEGQATEVGRAEFAAKVVTLTAVSFQVLVHT